jgi:hypothetical protein
MKTRNFLLILISIFLWLISYSPTLAQDEEIAAHQEQEYFEAKKALELAKQINAEKYALEPFQKAQDLIAVAEKAKSLKDGIKFGQASRLARAYAELAQTIAELKSEEEKLAAAYEELYKVKAEINRLQKSP